MGYIFHKLLILVILVHPQSLPHMAQASQSQSGLPSTKTSPTCSTVQQRQHGTAPSGMVPEMVSFKWYINLLMMIIWFQPLWKTWKSVGMIVPYIYIWKHSKNMFQTTNQMVIWHSKPGRVSSSMMDSQKYKCSSPFCKSTPKHLL